MRIAALLCALFGSQLLSAQDIRVDRSNKTIAVTAEESVSVDPDLAVVTVGYQNYAPLNKEAYDDNRRSADRIIAALLKAGIKQENLVTGDVRVSRVDPEEKWTAEQRKQRLFEAKQSWKIYVKAKEAQRIVDLAMNSGANSLEGVEWEVADRTALQAKAGGAALGKARAIAEQMAKGLGTTLGELVYASNRAPIPKFLRPYLATEPGLGGVVAAEAPPLRLFPEKVEERATVHAVFAIQ